LESYHERSSVGEFGRTPKLGQFTETVDPASEHSAATRRKPAATTGRTPSRPYWPAAEYEASDVRGGQVYGATTRDGGYVAERPVTPADLTATILYHLGIDFTQQYEDEFQRLRNRLSDGKPVKDLG
jgi:hypothetical protein